jgi:hypothetical protein
MAMTLEQEGTRAKYSKIAVREHDNRASPNRLLSQRHRLPTDQNNSHHIVMTIQAEMIPEKQNSRKGPSGGKKI